MGGFRPCSTPGCFNFANRSHTKCSQCRYLTRRGRADKPALQVMGATLADTGIRLDETKTPAELVFFNGERVRAPLNGLERHVLEPFEGKRGWWRVMAVVKKTKESNEA